MKPIWKAALIVLGLGVLTLKACALSGGPMDGVVIDESTGKPVADAIVVVHWRGSWFRLLRGGGRICYHAETARTDADGRFHIGKWTRSWSIDNLRIMSDGLGLRVYKPGFWDNTPTSPPTPNITYIVPFKGTKAEYFKEVLGSPSWGCESEHESSKNKYRLHRAMANEAMALAETSEQRSLARLLAKLAEESLINED